MKVRPCFFVYAREIKLFIIYMTNIFKIIEFF
jgi:hypothetical protein